LGWSDARKAGALLFFGVAQFALFEMVAEFVYPGYSVSQNYISDLGPPCVNGGGCPSQGSWLIFDTSIALMGIAVILTGILIQRHFKWKPFSGVVILAGIGALGVGVFNETAPYGLHGIFSLITFVGIGLTAILSYKLQKAPLSYFGVILGLLTLAFLVLYIPGTGAEGTAIGIGPGGLERLIVYPVLIWSLAFSGHLMATD
jgi:hypothetical membrane protein